MCAIQASSVEESSQKSAPAISDQGAEDRKKTLLGDNAMSTLEKYESLASGGPQVPKQESSGGLFGFFGSKGDSAVSESTEKEEKKAEPKADATPKLSFGKKAAEKSTPQKEADVSVPTAPKFNMPKAPKVAIPQFPKVDAPKFNIPQMPKFQVPAAPKKDSPDVPAGKSTPQIALPKFEAPKFSLPQKPSGDGKKSGESSNVLPSKGGSEAKGPQLPSFALPKFDMPPVPSFSMPKKDTDEQVGRSVHSSFHSHEVKCYMFVYFLRN